MLPYIELKTVFAEGQSSSYTIKFKNKSDLDAFVNITPGIIKVCEKCPYSLAFSTIRKGTGIVHIMPEKINPEYSSSEGDIEYAIDFILGPCGAYSWGFILSDCPSLDFNMRQHDNTIIAMAAYNGGAGSLALKIDGKSFESQKKFNWVWSRRWYRLVLNINNKDKNIRFAAIDLADGKTIDTVSIRGVDFLRQTPFQLFILTECPYPMNYFLRVGLFSVTISH